MSLRARLFEVHGEYISSATYTDQELASDELHHFIGMCANGEEVFVAQHDAGSEFASVYWFLQDTLPSGVDYPTAIKSMCTPNTRVAYMRRGESHRNFYVDEHGDRFSLVFEFLAEHADVS